MVSDELLRIETPTRLTTLRHATTAEPGVWLELFQRTRGRRRMEHAVWIDLETAAQLWPSVNNLSAPSPGA